MQVGALVRVCMGNSHGKIIAQSFVTTRAQIEALGLDWLEVARKVGFDPNIIDDPEAFVPAGLFFAIHEYLAEATGNDAIGLVLGAQVPVGASRIFDYVALTAPTIAQSLENWCRFDKLVSNIAQASLHDEAGKRYLTWKVNDLFGHYAQATAKAMAFAGTRIKHMLAGTRADLSFEFTQSEPRQIETYYTILGRNIRFNRPENRIGIPLEVMNVVPPAAEENLYYLIEQTALAKLADSRFEDNELENISRAIQQALKDGDASLDVIARNMGMSKRALQRKMEENGLSFRQALDRVRKALAEQYLKEGKLRLSEIAFLLGYSELSTFSRAAKAWFGVPPKEFRRRQKVSGTR